MPSRRRQEFVASQVFYTKSPLCACSSGMINRDEFIPLRNHSLIGLRVPKAKAMKNSRKSSSHTKLMFFHVNQMHGKARSQGTQFRKKQNQNTTAMLNKNSDAFADVLLLGLQLGVNADSKGSVSFSIAGVSPSPDLILLLKIMASYKNVFIEK